MINQLSELIVANLYQLVLFRIVGCCKYFVKGGTGTPWTEHQSLIQHKNCKCFSRLRVTGKMVGTTSHESVQAGTKLLDIPLNPENNMTAL